MKDKILFLILGILIGAVITAGVFLLISNNNSQNMDGNMGNRGGGNFGNMVDGEMSLPDGEERGSRPDDTTGSDSTEDTSSDDSTDSNT